MDKRISALKLGMCSKETCLAVTEKVLGCDHGQAPWMDTMLRHTYYFMVDDKDAATCTEQEYKLRMQLSSVVCRFDLKFVMDAITGTCPFPSYRHFALAVFLDSKWHWHWKVHVEDVFRVFRGCVAAAPCEWLLPSEAAALIDIFALHGMVAREFLQHLAPAWVVMGPVVGAQIVKVLRKHAWSTFTPAQPLQDAILQAVQLDTGSFGQCTREVMRYITQSPFAASAPVKMACVQRIKAWQHGVVPMEHACAALQFLPILPPGGHQMAVIMRVLTRVAPLPDTCIGVLDDLRAHLKEVMRMPWVHTTQLHAVLACKLKILLSGPPPKAVVFPAAVLKELQEAACALREQEECAHMDALVLTLLMYKQAERETASVLEALLPCMCMLSEVALGRVSDASRTLRFVVYDILREREGRWTLIRSAWLAALLRGINK